MTDFSYIAEKIENAEFCYEPFKHIIIDDFFSGEHFSRIINSPQIRTPHFNANQDVIDGLLRLGYVPQPFPGCITDTKEYVEFADGKKKFNKNLIEGYGRDVIEGYGITMRMQDVRDAFLKSVIDYFNGQEFQHTIRKKFGIDEGLSVETAIQKNLMHYEISPHCDTSRKALTYMINVYNVDDCADRQMHTHLLRFKPEYRYLYEIWKNNDFDPVWVPWDWCETVKKTETNNSISIFKPSYDTLHAVQVKEEHFTHQRNQIYGNLWYPKCKKTKYKNWRSLDLVSENRQSLNRCKKITYHIKEIARTVYRG